MFLKKIYDHSSGSPVVSHVEVKSAPATQKITPRFLQQNLASGLVSASNGQITIKTAEGEDDLVYKIQQGPGLYCCHCEEPLDDSKAAQTHVAEEHEDEDSPDENNPAGYRMDNFYLCTKEEA